MATQTIDATLFASSHPDIAKRTSVSGLIISVGMMLVGILIFASIFEMSDKSSTLSMGLMVLGTANLPRRIPVDEVYVEPAEQQKQE